MQKKKTLHNMNLGHLLVKYDSKRPTCMASSTTSQATSFLPWCGDRGLQGSAGDVQAGAACTHSQDQGWGEAQAWGSQALQLHELDAGQQALCKLAEAMCTLPRTIIESSHQLCFLIS